MLEKKGANLLLTCHFGSVYLSCQSTQMWGLGDTGQIERTPPPLSDVDLSLVLGRYGSGDPVAPPAPQLLFFMLLQLQVHAVLDHLIGDPEGFSSRHGGRHGRYGVVLPPRHALLRRFHAQVEQLDQAEGEGDHRRHQHEPDDDRLLRRPGQEAVHLVGARVALADVAGVESEAEEEVLAGDEGAFQDDLGHQVEGVAAEEAPADADLAGAFQVLGDFVGPEEETRLCIQLGLLPHLFLLLGKNESTSDGQNKAAGDQFCCEDGLK